MAKDASKWLRLLAVTILVAAVLFMVNWWGAGGLEHAQKTSFTSVLLLHFVYAFVWACIFVGVVWAISREDAKREGKKP